MVKIPLIVTTLLFALSISLFGTTPTPSLACTPETEDPVVKKIRDISWTIKGANNAGSGVLFTRKEKDDNIHFFWTAGHVIARYQTVTTKLDPVRRTPIIHVEYPEFDIHQEILEDGRIVGNKSYKVKVIRYSEVTHGEDLAVLKVIKKNVTTESVEFSRSKTFIGTSVWHIGSMGFGYPNSLSFGILSKVGVISYGDKLYDQYTLAAQRGCSGGGIFLKKNGECVGLLVEGLFTNHELNTSIIFSRSAKTLISFAKRTKCEWALDRSVPLPYNDDTPIEDVPIALPKGRFVPDELEKEKEN